jgi:hypothetical protein
LYANYIKGVSLPNVTYSDVDFDIIETVPGFKDTPYGSKDDQDKKELVLDVDYKYDEVDITTCFTKQVDVFGDKINIKEITTLTPPDLSVIPNSTQHNFAAMPQTIIHTDLTDDWNLNEIKQNDDNSNIIITERPHQFISGVSDLTAKNVSMILLQIALDRLRPRRGGAGMVIYPLIATAFIGTAAISAYFLVSKIVSRYTSKTLIKRPYDPPRIIRGKQESEIVQFVNAEHDPLAKITKMRIKHGDKEFIAKKDYPLIVDTDDYDPKSLEPVFAVPNSRRSISDSALEFAYNNNVAHMTLESNQGTDPVLLKLQKEINHYYACEHEAGVWKSRHFKKSRRIGDAIKRGGWKRSSQPYDAKDYDTVATDLYYDSQGNVVFKVDTDTKTQFVTVHRVVNGRPIKFTAGTGRGVLEQIKSETQQCVKVHDDNYVDLDALTTVIVASKNWKYKNDTLIPQSVNGFPKVGGCFVRQEDNPDAVAFRASGNAKLSGKIFCLNIVDMSAAGTPAIMHDEFSVFKKDVKWVPVRNEDAWEYLKVCSINERDIPYGETFNFGHYVPHEGKRVPIIVKWEILEKKCKQIADMTTEKHESLIYNSGYDKWHDAVFDITINDPFVNIRQDGTSVIPAQHACYIKLPNYPCVVLANTHSFDPVGDYNPPKRIYTVIANAGKDQWNMYLKALFFWDDIACFVEVSSKGIPVSPRKKPLHVEFPSFDRDRVGHHCLIGCYHCNKMNQTEALEVGDFDYTLNTKDGDCGRPFVYYDIASQILHLQGLHSYGARHGMRKNGAHPFVTEKQFSVLVSPDKITSLPKHEACTYVGRLNTPMRIIENDMAPHDFALDFIKDKVDLSKYELKIATLDTYRIGVNKYNLVADWSLNDSDELVRMTDLIFLSFWREYMVCKLPSFDLFLELMKRSGTGQLNHTSPGYPFFKISNDKVHLYNKIGKAIFQGILSGEVINLAVIASNMAKLEVRASEKEQRYIMSMPAHHTGVGVCLFSNHYKLYKEDCCNPNCPAAIGLDLNADIDEIYGGLIGASRSEDGDVDMKFCFVFSGDADKRDTSTSSWLIRHIFDLYKKYMIPPSQHYLLDWYVENIVNTFVRNPPNELWQKDMGNPSGNYSTTDINTKSTHWECIYAKLKMYEAEARASKDILKWYKMNFRTKHGGDDFIIATSRTDFTREKYISCLPGSVSVTFDFPDKEPSIFNSTFFSMQPTVCSYDSNNEFTVRAKHAKPERVYVKMAYKKLSQDDTVFYSKVCNALVWMWWDINERTYLLKLKSKLDGYFRNERTKGKFQHWVFIPLENIMSHKGIKFHESKQGYSHPFRPGQKGHHNQRRDRCELYSIKNLHKKFMNIWRDLNNLDSTENNLQDLVDYLDCWSTPNSWTTKEELKESRIEKDAWKLAQIKMLFADRQKTVWKQQFVRVTLRFPILPRSHTFIQDLTGNLMKKIFMPYYEAYPFQQGRVSIMVANFAELRIPFNEKLEFLQNSRKLPNKVLHYIPAWNHPETRHRAINQMCLSVGEDYGTFKRQECRCVQRSLILMTERMTPKEFYNFANMIYTFNGIRCTVKENPKAKTKFLDTLQKYEDAWDYNFRKIFGHHVDCEHYTVAKPQFCLYAYEKLFNYARMYHLISLNHQHIFWLRTQSMDYYRNEYIANNTNETYAIHWENNHTKKKEVIAYYLKFDLNRRKHQSSRFTTQISFKDNVNYTNVNDRRSDYDVKILQWFNSAPSTYNHLANFIDSEFDDTFVNLEHEPIVVEPHYHLSFTQNNTETTIYLERRRRNNHQGATAGVYNINMQNNNNAGVGLNRGQNRNFKKIRTKNAQQKAYRVKGAQAGALAIVNAGKAARWRSQIPPALPRARKRMGADLGAGFNMRAKNSMASQRQNMLNMAGYNRISKSGIPRYPKMSSMAKYGLPDCCIRALRDLYSFGDNANTPAPIDNGSHQAATAAVASLALELDNPVAASDSTNFETFIVHSGDFRYGVLKSVQSTAGFQYEPIAEAGDGFAPTCILQCNSAGFVWGTIFNPRTEQFLLSNYIPGIGAHAWPMITDGPATIIFNTGGGSFDGSDGSKQSMDNGTLFRIRFYKQSDNSLLYDSGEVSGFASIPITYTSGMNFTVEILGTGAYGPVNMAIGIDDDTDSFKGGAGTPYVLEAQSWNTAPNLIGRASQIRVNSSAIVITNAQSSLIANGSIVAGKITANQAPQSTWDTYLFGQPTYYCGKFKEGIFSGHINDYVQPWQNTGVAITNPFASPSVNCGVIHIVATTKDVNTSAIQAEVKVRGWVDYLTNDASIAQSFIANESPIWITTVGYAIKTMIYTDNPNHVQVLKFLHDAIMKLKSDPDARAHAWNALKSAGKFGLQAGGILAAML